MVRVARVGLVFGFVTLAWVFFKLPRIADAAAFFTALGDNWRLPFRAGPALVIALYAAPVIAYHGWYLWHRGGAPAWRASPRLEPIAYGVLASAILLNAGPLDAFIYFQF